MPLAQEQKTKIFETFGKNVKDTGSTKVQIALLTTRIVELTEHLGNNPKDFACRRGLVKLVGQRRRLLNYYKDSVSLDDYKELLSSLDLRK